MKKYLSRLFGLLLVAAAVLGMLGAFYGILRVWRVKPILEEDLNQNLALLEEAITTTNQVLTITEGTLSTVSGSISSVQSTTASLAQSLEDAVPILDSLDRLVRNDLPATITATQTSLASAQTSAKLIDDVLGAITQLPLLPLDQYAPEIPLHVALGQVSESLDPLPASFENIADSLETARGNLSELQVQVKGVNAELDEINANLASATSAITQYRAITHELQVKIDAAQTKLSSSLNRISWTVTAILCWLIIASLGLLTQGLEFFGVQIH